MSAERREDLQVDDPQSRDDRIVRVRAAGRGGGSAAARDRLASTSGSASKWPFTYQA